MTVKKWIILLGVMFLLGMGAQFAANMIISDRLFRDVTMPQITDALREKYEYSLKAVVDVEVQMLAQELKGISDPEQQRKLVEQLTDAPRFFPNDEGYYFSYDLKGIRVNVPINKSLNGTNCADLRDPDGVYFIRKFIEAAQAGGGFVEYRFEKPSAGIQPKLSYARQIPGTDILIGTGVYIDSVSEEKSRISDLVLARNHQFMLYQLWACLAVAGLLAVAAWYVARAICTPLRDLTAASQRVAEGHLDTRLILSPHSPREILSLHSTMRVMIGNLRDRIEEAARKSQEASVAMEQSRVAQKESESARMYTEAKQAELLKAADQLEDISEILFSASTQLSAQIEQSDRGAAESAHRLSESATAMGQMNATVREVASNASSASGASAETRAKAQNGSSIVAKAVQSIEQVRHISEELKIDMEQLNAQAQSISQIMNVISDIADQTNLLALNAAIEAARAGEAGRGFAVVADEVRKLAEKTMASTQDVGKAIKDIQNSTAKSSASVDSAVEQIAQATEFATASGQALQEIVDTVVSTADQVNAIATASEEQSTASNEINKSIERASAMSRQTAQAMDEASKAVSSLVAQAEKLTVLIREMKRA